VGTQLPQGEYSRLELLHAMLVKSDNAAAETLAENYPGGRSVFMFMMNLKAQDLNLLYTQFVDPSGLSVFNVSTLHEVVAIFKDEGESAKDLSSKNRKEFLRALEFCRKNKIDAFVVLRVSRFARNTEDHFAVRKILSKYGTALHSVTEPIGNKPSEKFIETVLAGAADYDNAIRRQQSIDGMCQKIKQGISPWKPPVGYICNHNKIQGQKKTEPDQIHPQVFPILQKVLRQYSKQLITEKGITIELAKTDFEKLTGIKPTKQFVHQLFGTRLTFYAGWLTNPWPAEDDSDKLIKGKHLAMITENEWELIKQTK
jgi:DNA invertase Pin-like site-specific DNA recombinase